MLRFCLSCYITQKAFAPYSGQPVPLLFSSFIFNGWCESHICTTLSTFFFLQSSPWQLKLCSLPDIACSLSLVSSHLGHTWTKPLFVVHLWFSFDWVSCIFFFLFIFFICGGFCHTLKWNSQGFTCVPHPNPPSHLPLHPFPLGFPSAY